jgi:predicted DNA-binding transcriptional regulator
MNRDQSIGATILVASVLALVAYSYLLYMYATIVLQITAFVAVALILIILGWIGWTMATTPPPAPLDFDTTKMDNAGTMGQESSKGSESSDSPS